MQTLNINFENQTVKAYDNNGAHNAAKLIMRKFENMNIQFKTGKDNFPYAWLESKSTVGFKLILNQKELTWLMGYLKREKRKTLVQNPKRWKPTKMEKIVIYRCQFSNNL